MTDLNQFLNQDMTADDANHTSGIGAGGAGGLSMEQRRKLLNQPRVVGAYQYSRLGRQGSSAKVRTVGEDGKRVYDVSNDSFTNTSTPGNRHQGDVKELPKQDAQSVERRQHFIEPPKRGYDKYS